jgi:phage terminase large subunit
MPSSIIPPKFVHLFEPHRYKVYYGGRGGAKSWAYARALLIIAKQYPVRILCAREFQTSITDSVHRLLCDQISALGFDRDFTPGRSVIKSRSGAEFMFEGLRHNIKEIKSKEGIDICWVEEAESVSKESWDILIPTIRKDGSEIWISYNPMEEEAPTHQRFVVKPHPDSIVVKVNWSDNPHFPETLNRERLHLKSIDPEGAYLNVWEGETLTLTDSIIFKGKYVIDTFDTPDDARFFYGTDWGFAEDPTTLNRCFVKDNILYIDYEANGVGVELDEIPDLFDAVPGSRDWPIKADSSRPETVSHVRKKGFRIQGAKKWAGSVEDGITYLRSFKKIIIHPRCKHTADEFRHYSYKVDRKTGDILPIIVDAFNHHIDGIRYSLDGYIHKGATAFADFAEEARNAAGNSTSHEWQQVGTGRAYKCTCCGIAVMTKANTTPQEVAEKQGWKECKKS